MAILLLVVLQANALGLSSTGGVWESPAGTLIEAALEAAFIPHPPDAKRISVEARNVTLHFFSMLVYDDDPTTPQVQHVHAASSDAWEAEWIKLETAEIGKASRAPGREWVGVVGLGASLVSSPTDASVALAPLEGAELGNVPPVGSRIDVARHTFGISVPGASLLSGSRSSLNITGSMEILFFGPNLLLTTHSGERIFYTGHTAFRDMSGGHSDWIDWLVVSFSDGVIQFEGPLDYEIAATEMTLAQASDLSLSSSSSEQSRRLRVVAERDGRDVVATFHPITPAEDEGLSAWEASISGEDRKFFESPLALSGVIGVIVVLTSLVGAWSLRRRHPMSSAEMLHAAETAVSGGNMAAALMWARRARQRAPRLPRALRYEADLLFAVGRNREAYRRYAKLAWKSSDAEAAMRAWVIGATLGKRRSEVVSLLDRAVELDPRLAIECAGLPEITTLQPLTAAEAPHFAAEIGPLQPFSERVSRR